MSQIRKIKDMKTAKKGSTGNVTPLKKVTLVEKEEVINISFYFLNGLFQMHRFNIGQSPCSTYSLLLLHMPNDPGKWVFRIKIKF